MVNLTSAGFLALLALAIYTGVTVTFFGKRFLDWRFSWSYIIGWVAIILAFAAGILFLLHKMLHSSAGCSRVREDPYLGPRCQLEVPSSGLTV